MAPSDARSALKPDTARVLTAGNREYRRLRPAAVGRAEGVHSVPFGPDGVCGAHRQLLVEGSAVGSGLAGEAWRRARHFGSSSNTRVRCPARPPPTVCRKARSLEGCG